MRELKTRVYADKFATFLVFPEKFYRPFNSTSFSVSNV